jgi:hypothetical protein
VKTLELYRWLHTDAMTGKRVKTRYLLTAEDAQARLVGAEAIVYTLERRLVPESIEEEQHTSVLARSKETD